MKNHCLTFADEAEMITKLAQYRIETVDGMKWSQSSNDHALDVIGAIYKPTGTFSTDADGNRFADMADVGGYHANLKLIELPADLVPYEVFPETRSRVWA